MGIFLNARLLNFLNKQSTYTLVTEITKEFLLWMK